MADDRHYRPPIRPLAGKIPMHKPPASGRSATRVPLPTNKLPKPVKIANLKLPTSSDDIDKLQRLRSSKSGRILVIVANGPSITEIDLPRLLEFGDVVDTMSINRPDYRIWPTTAWALCDASVFQRYHGLWTAYDGLIVTSTGITATKPNSVRIKVLHSKSDDCFSRDLLSGYYIGYSTVYASMQVALWLGYASVYIVGVDMCVVGGKLHFYGVNADVDPDDRQRRFKVEASYYTKAAKLLSPSERVIFKFCSNYNIWSFVDDFVRIDHHNMLAVLASEVAELARQR